jgi:hypothetical protein
MHDESTTAPTPADAADPAPLVLAGVRGKWVRVFLVMAVFFAIGLIPRYQQQHPFAAWSTLLFCGAGSLFSLAQILLPAARGTLTLDTLGFEIKTFGRRHRTSWKDVEAFGVMHMSGARMIGLVYRSGYQRQRAGRQLASGLTGVEGAIPDNYEVKGDALVALLESWHARFG